MASFVELLKEKRATVLGEIEALRGQVADLSGQIAAKESQLKNMDELLAIEGAPVSPATPDPTTMQTRSNPFLAAAARLLTESGQPLHYRTIALKLAEQGVYVPGQDPAANLLSHMTRDPRFGRAGGRGMYGLAEWPSFKATAAGRHSRRDVRVPRKRSNAKRPRR